MGLDNTDISVVLPPETYTRKPVSTYKRIMCGNNPFGDWHHLFWRGLDCICCGFYRGMFLGIAYSTVFYGTLWLLT
jgi:hypothetical protein